ncbi:MAG: class GN sortase [Candidatus Sedimenticola sp. PURPLELP]
MMWYRMLAAGLLVLGGWQFSQGVYIEAKAYLAQELLQQAWQETRQGGARVPPWPWADTWPVARLKMTRLDVDQVVLAGASGRTLAFGPGHLFGTADPATPGNSVISGHRDTHFSFLKSVLPGDRIELVRPDGGVVEYAVYHRSVQHRDNLDVLLKDGSQLTLVTCYPFDALVPGGEERYVVEALPVLL